MDDDMPSNNGHYVRSEDEKKKTIKRTMTPAPVNSVISSPQNSEIDSGLYSSASYIPDLEIKSSIFSTPPTIVSVVGRLVNSWPVKRVIYDIELEYKSFKWSIAITKQNLYSLWFHIKTEILASSIQTAASRIAGEQAEPLVDYKSQITKVFVSNNDKSLTPAITLIIEQYLNHIFSIPEFLSSPRILAILEVSATTFDADGEYTSIKEGWLLVRTWLRGTTADSRIIHGQISCNNNCFNCFCMVKRVNLIRKRWKWVVLKESYLAVYNSVTEIEPIYVLLFDPKFMIEKGISRVGSSTCIIASNNSFVMELDAGTKEKISVWANSLRSTIEKSEWNVFHRDESFSPIRDPGILCSRAMWFVDGKDMFEAVYYSILNAQSEIFIAGWWLSPELLLIRSDQENPLYKIDNLLKKKAEEGVKIYILIYKEVAVALTLDSLHTKQHLQKLHKNIRVLRDPDFIVKQLGLWSHHEKIVVIDQKRGFLGGLDLCLGRYDTSSHSLLDTTAPYIFPGKDYSNPRIIDFIEVNKPHIDLLDREKQPRMPWHDVHCCIEGQPAQDLARHFIQRWNYSVAARSKKEHYRMLVPPLVAYKHSSSSVKRFKTVAKKVMLLNTLKQPNKMKKDASIRGFSSLDTAAKFKQDAPRGDLLDEKPITAQDELHEENCIEPSIGESSLPCLNTISPCFCQILRSVTYWSAGCPTEKSIQNSYLRLINESRHFIYIENQFFISGLNGDSLVSNRIADAIVSRIRRANTNKEVFRVVVFMPLLPGFPGRPDEKDAYSLRGVLHWQYRSICRGGNSIYERLYQLVDDPFEYIAFYGLRTHQFIANNQPVTEEIYIHSKLLIVDDTSVIMGSANINERSMSGDRDSEIAIIIEDTELVKSTLNGEETFVGKFAHSLRMKLFEEHFGLVQGSVQYNRFEDIVISSTWFDMQEIAMQNSRIYDQVFGCLPNDYILDFRDLLSPSKATKLKAKQSSVPSQHNEEVKDEVVQEKTNEDLIEAQLEPAEDASTNRSSFTDMPPRKQNAAIGSNLVDSKTTKDRGDLLKGIVGHVVYFPLNFLSKEALEPNLYPAEIFN